MRKYIFALILFAIFFAGCSQDLMNGMMSSITPSFSSSIRANPIHVMQGQAAGLSATLNPATLGVTAVTGAISKRNEEANLKAYNKLKNTNINDMVKSHSKEIVEQYNKENGTNFTTLQEIQNDTKLRVYNKEHGTNFTTLSQVKQYIKSQK